MKSLQTSSLISRLINELVFSSSKGAVFFRWFLTIILVLAGVANFFRCFQSFTSEFIFRKDLIQEYLMARAIWAGWDPYLPCPELAIRVFGSLPDNIVNHPTPHPPTMAVIFLPLGLLPYPWASVLWFFLEIFCLFGISWLIWQWLTGRRGRTLLWQSVLMTLALLVWTPFIHDVSVGQLMVPILLLILISWRQLTTGHNVAAGIWLGGAIAIKLVAWPFVVFLALKRKWRTVAATLIVVALFNLIAAMLMGLETVVQYYLRIGPLIAQLHRTSSDNFSLWTVAPRFFEQTGSEILLGLEAPPIIFFPELSHSLSFLLPSIILLGGMLCAYRARFLDVSFGMLLCIIILFSPVAWASYLTLALFPLCVCIRYLYYADWPLWETILLVIVINIFLIAPNPLRSFFYLMALKPYPPHFPQWPFAVPVWVAFLTLLPAAALILLLILLSRLDRSYNHVVEEISGRV